MFVPGAVFIKTNFVYSLAACQCNGHSQCVNDSVCEKCEDLTTGRHCESCISGFYGDPTNGGNCQREYPRVVKSSSRSVRAASFNLSSVLQFSFISAISLNPRCTVKLPVGY